MSEIHEKMRKLLALAERGVGGEKETAQRMLEKMMKKYNVSFEDLEVETVATYWWNYDNKFEKQILFQTYGKVADKDTIKYYKGDRKCGFELSSSQYIEMDMHYTILRRDLKKHIERAVTAFIHANELFSSTPSKSHEYTDKELDEIWEMLSMANIITPSEINKRLNHKK